MKKLFIYLFLSLNALSSFGQTDNYGTEFWTGFMSNFYSTSELRLFIAAKTTTYVTVSIPLQSFSTKVLVLKDSVLIVKIPNSEGQINSSEVVEKTGIHILSDYPVAVTAMNLASATTDATVVFPLKNVPTNATYTTGHPSRVSNYVGNEFLIVSAENGAKIDIVPAAKTIKGKAKLTPFSITLDAGETYQVWADNKDILDGSTITCTNGKRIIVYTGDKCSAFPCGACDHQVEQVFPNQLLDTSYYVLPHFGHTKGYTVKVVSIDTTIWVKVNKKMFRVGKKDSALVLDVPSDDSVLHISGPRKFSCFQFMKGAFCNGYITNGWGDPSILQLLSFKYMGQNSSFNCVSSTNLTDHFVNILIYTASQNDVYLDGSKLAPSEFIPVSDNPDFSYAKIKIGLGVHTIYCKLGHLAYCYGIGNYESYLYTAGFSLPNFEIDIKDTTLSFDCKSNKVKMQFEAKLEGSIKSYKWDFGDGTYDTSKIVKHEYPVGKEFKIKLWALGYNSKEDSVIKKYTFNWPAFNPVFDKLLCDEKFNFEEKNPFFKNFIWHDLSKKNNYTATKTGKIWVSATDTSGYCKFSDTAQVWKIDVLSKIKVDTLSNCHLNNLFRFSDSSYVKNDQIKYKAWIFPGGVTFFDTSNFYYHFRQPGNFMVYLDIYPENALCKSRIEIPVKVNWNTDIDAIIDKDKYCNGEVATIKDNSYSCCQKVKKYYWELDDGTKLNSDSGILRTKVTYDYLNSNGIRNFNYISETEQGCRDTLKSGLIVWPAGKSNFDFGNDSVKCLVLSRWTFTHTVDESIAGSYSMLWNFGNGKTGSQNQYKNFRYTDTGTYKVKLTTTTSFGCIDSTIKHVKAIDNAIAKFSIPDSVQCFANNSFTVIDSSKGYNLKYIWNFGNGNTSTNSKPNPENYKLSGKYKVKLNVVSNYAGCVSDSVIHTVNVLKNPKADFKFNSDTVCYYNNSVVLTDASKFYNGKYKLYWKYGSVLDSAFAPVAIHFSDTGNYNILLIAKDSANCVDSVIKTISIKTEPNLKMTINDTVQCFGSNNFKIQSLQGFAIKNRVWTLDNTVILGSELQKELIDVSPQGKHKLTLVEETPFGCKDSITKWIEVLPQIKADFDFNKLLQCFSQHSADMINKSTAPQDIIKTFTYKESNNLVGNGSNIYNYKFTTPGTKTIQLNIETENGCRDSVVQSLYLFSDPQALFKSDSVCIGQSVTLKGLQIFGNSIVKWTWNMDDEVQYGPATIDSANHTYKNEGMYNPKVSFEDANGCKGTYSGDPIVIYPLPFADFSIKKLASDDQFTFVKLIPNTLGYSYYLWLFPDKTTNTIDTPTVKFSKFFKDRISLKVQTIYGCSDTASRYFYIFPELTELYHENAFTPNSDGLNEYFRPYSIDGASNYELRIFNRWGEQLFKTNDPKAGWNGTYKNELVQSGVYIFTVEFIYSDGNRYSTKGNLTIIR